MRAACPARPLRTPPRRRRPHAAGPAPWSTSGSRTSPRATAAHLDALATAVGPHDPPAGRLLSAAGPADGGWQVVQVRQDVAQLHASDRDVFLPALARLGPGAFPAAPTVVDLAPTVVEWGDLPSA